MTGTIPKISVLIITYKQEDVIQRALNSLLLQKDYLYEICVSDDCSPDRTWDVLLDYQKQYPDLIKLHRNEVNLGIFENIEQVWSMPTGDVVNIMAGDDESGEGWFKTVLEYIQQNDIDWKNELFCIYGNFKALYPNGDSMLFNNKAVAEYKGDAVRLGLRGLISTRGCCFSKKVLDKFEKVSQGRSHKVEHAQDRQLQIFALKNYYIPKLANIYNTGIGVSTTIQDEETYKDRLEIWPYTIKYLKNKGILLCKKDLYYGDYNIAMKQFRHKRTVGNLFHVVWTFFASRDFSLPKGNGIRHLIFAMRRRIPHNKVIEM